MALLESGRVALGTPAPDFALPGTDDTTHRLSDFADAPVLVVAFICNHCPYVRAIEGRLVDLAADYAPRGVQLVGINSNDADTYPDDSLPHMKARAKERGYRFPYLVDETQEVARAYGAVCTPDFFVYGPDRRLAYHGRLDDNWKDAPAVRQRELRAALDRLLAGDTPAAQQIPSMGCNIKWKPGNEPACFV